MLRRLDHLITIARESTDYKDINGISDREIIEYFNDGQRTIQGLIFAMDLQTNLFLKSVFIDALANTTFYDLPEDMFAENAIYYVEEQSSSGINFYPIMRIQPMEKRQRRGYYVEEKKISFSPTQEFNQASRWKITYFRTAKTIGKRSGKVNTVDNALKTIALSAGFDQDLDLVNDYCSFVDFNGNTVLEEVPILDYTAGVITTDAAIDLSALTNVHYVVAGKRSTTHSELPDYCETLLLDYVRARIYARAASIAFNPQSAITADQRENLRQIFTNHTKDILSPTITDTDYLGY